MAEEDRRQGRQSDRWVYFQQLRDKVEEELKQEGRSPLLEAVLQQRECYFLEHMALDDVCSVLLDGRRPRTYGDGIEVVEDEQSKYFCSARKYKISWNELNMGRTLRNVYMTISKKNLARWRALQQYGRQRAGEREEERNRQAAGAQTGDLTRQLQERIAALERTNQALSRELTERKEEAVRLRSDLLAREQMAEDLRGQLQELRRQVQSDEEALLRPAREEAAAIRAEAVRQGEEEARRVSEQIRASAERCRTERRREIADLWQEEYAKGDRDRQEYTERLMEVRRDLTQGTSRFQGELVSRLNATVEDLNRIKQEICTDLRTWQENLYRTQHEPLALCYVNLVRILDRGEGLAMEEEDRTEEGQRGEVRRLLGTLDRFRQSLEKAMARLGLRVYYAQSGAFFDPARHIEAGAEYDGGYSGEGSCRRVRRCVCPGVEYRISDDEDSRVITRAEVELEG